MTPNEVVTVPTEDAIFAEVLCARQTRTSAHRFPQFYGNPRFRGNANLNREVDGQDGVLRPVRAAASAIEVVLTRPTK